MADDKPWHRRIVICCDGTWQSSVSGIDNVPSNVTKLCRVIARIGEDKDKNKFHQLVYYDSGIGTGALSTSERRRQGGVGAGLAENVIEAYNFIVLNYEPGDEIFCFGFSRGAYTARAVAGLVTDIGVIKPNHMQVFSELYRTYKKNDEGMVFRETEAFKEFVTGKLTPYGKNISAEQRGTSAMEHALSYEINPHDDLIGTEDSRKVKVVGVWDTVGSLGIPDVRWFNFSGLRTKYGFHNVKLNENIQHAYHALALDERRQAFSPTLWYIPKDLTHDLPELKQVWFPGVHINSGGGSDDAIQNMCGDLENLSNASFTWMLQCIAPHLTIDQDAFETYMVHYQRWLFKIRYACTYHHTTKLEDWASWFTSKIPHIPYLNPAPDELADPRRDPQHPHPTFDFGWGTGSIVDSYSGMYKIAGPQPRLPGQCTTNVFKRDTGQTNGKITGKYEPELIRGHGYTHEYIHPICRYRDIILGGDPAERARSALRDFTRTYEPTTDDADTGRFWWSHPKDTKKSDRLPEWIILPHEDGQVNYERSWYERCEVSKAAAERLQAAGYKGDWLAATDEKVDFSVGERQGYVYP